MFWFYWCVLIFLILYTCGKYRVFENLLSSHFVFDPEELDVIVKKAVAKYPNSAQLTITEPPVCHKATNEKTVATTMGGHNDEELITCTVDIQGGESREWTRQAPDMDGKFISTPENPDTIFERRCEYILELLHEKYPSYCVDKKVMNFFDSRKMKDQWMFNMCGVCFLFI